MRYEQARGPRIIILILSIATNVVHTQCIQWISRKSDNWGTHQMWLVFLYIIMIIVYITLNFIPINFKIIWPFWSNIRNFEFDPYTEARTEWPLWSYVMNFEFPPYLMAKLNGHFGPI